MYESFLLKLLENSRIQFEVKFYREESMLWKRKQTTAR